MKAKSLRRDKDIFDKIFYGLLVAAIPFVVLDFFYNLPSGLQSFLNLYFVIVYVLFVLELIVRLYFSRDKLLYVKHNWIEFIIVLFPFLGILRLAPLLEETFIIGIDALMKKFTHPRHLVVINTLIVMLIAIVVTSGIILQLESPFKESHIRSFPDALWWSTVGVFTMGLGDEVPISPWGRALTLLLVLLGVISLSLITANIAALFTEQDIKKDMDRELNIIEADINKVEKGMKHEVSQDDRIVEAKVEELEKKIQELKKS